MNTTTKDKVLALLKLHGYAWQQSGFYASGGVGTHPSGYKVAVDFATGGWMHYRTRKDASKEGKGLAALQAFLQGRAKANAAELAAHQAAQAAYWEKRNSVRCPDHRNGGATRCPRGGAALQIWQRRQWGD